MNVIEMLERCAAHQLPLYLGDVADVSGPYEQAINLNRDRIQEGENFPIDPDWAPPPGSWTEAIRDYD